jgi:CheY-like chemotaxis protein
MKILVLDDDENRLKAFRRKFIGHEVDCVTIASEAIELLKQSTFDSAFFDHDLGGKVFVASGPGTGYEVAKWLEEHPDRKPKMVYIHSFNPVGANNMKRALPEAILAPGLWHE